MRVDAVPGSEPGLLVERMKHVHQRVALGERGQMRRRWALVADRQPAGEIQIARFDVCGLLWVIKRRKFVEAIIP